MNAQGDRPGRLVDDVDEGLAAERTELAWGRSLLSLFACGAAIAKGVPHVDGGEGRPVLGVIVLGIATVVWLSGMPLRRIEERSHQPVAARWPIALVAGGTAVVGIAAVLLAVLFPP
jgi:uncharacterized membrane protein YidH (DUF202 family)